VEERAAGSGVRAGGVPRVEVHRASARSRTGGAGLELRHAFSATAAAYDPGNTSHGLLLVHDEVVIAGGAGFARHRHRDEEIVTWVLSGALRSEDATGRSGVLRPGGVQRTSAGTGIEHSEVNADRDPSGAVVRVLQMRVVPDGDGRRPDHEQRDVTDALATGELVAVVSGRGHAGAVGLGSRSAALHVARLRPGQVVVLPDAPYLHLHVATGRVALEGGAVERGAADGAGGSPAEVELGTGDAVRATAGGGQRVTALDAAEVLVWEMHRGLR
jgi:hypothetical protein